MPAHAVSVKSPCKWALFGERLRAKKTFRYSTNRALSRLFWRESSICPVSNISLALVGARCFDPSMQRTTLTTAGLTQWVLTVNGIVRGRFDSLYAACAERARWEA